VVNELNKLEEDLLRSLAVVRNGLHQLQTESKRDPSAEEAVEAEDVQAAKSG
jgi:hypothetical protein